MTGAEIFAITMALINVVGMPVLLKIFSDVRAADKVAVAAFALAAEGKLLSSEALEKLHAHKLHVAQDYISTQAFEKFETRLFNELESIKADMRANRA